MSEELEKELKKEEVEISKDKAVIPYSVFGTDLVITDPDLIDYYKTRFKILIVTLNLIGKITNKGEYIVSDEVKGDLVRMPKEIENFGENFYDASNTFAKKEFYFHIDITPLKDNKAKASLYLFEYVGDYFNEDKIKTHIADFVDEYNDDFRVNVRKVFNLMDIKVPVSDLLVTNLAVVMQDNFDMAAVVEDLYDLASQIYTMRMLELLAKSGETGQAIVKEYNDLVAAKQNQLNNAKCKNTFLKSLLDKTIDQNGGLEKLDVNKDEKGKIIKEINGNIKAIEGAKKPQVLESSSNKKDEKEVKKVLGQEAQKPKSAPNTDKNKTKGNNGGKKAENKETKKDPKTKVATKGEGVPVDLSPTPKEISIKPAPVTTSNEKKSSANNNKQENNKGKNVDNEQKKGEKEEKKTINLDDDPLSLPDSKTKPRFDELSNNDIGKKNLLEEPIIKNEERSLKIKTPKLSRTEKPEEMIELDNG
jgi:hypothetical protein